MVRPSLQIDAWVNTIFQNIEYCSSSSVNVSLLQFKGLRCWYIWKHLYFVFDRYIYLLL